MSAESNLELMTSEELLKMDLGKSIFDIFDYLESLKVDDMGLTIIDIHYCNSMAQMAMENASRIRLEITRVLKAKTHAQHRLTSRQTRYQMQVNHKLENDANVKAGLSLEDRKARAANSLIDLVNAIKESENEVESLKNVKQALDVSLRDFNSQKSYYKDHAKLLKEGGLSVSLPDNGNPHSPKTLDQSIQSIEEKYKVGVSSVEEVSGESEISEEEFSIEESSEALMSAFDQVNESFSVREDREYGEEPAMGFTLPGEELELPENTLDQKEMEFPGYEDSPHELESANEQMLLEDSISLEDEGVTLRSDNSEEGTSKTSRESEISDGFSLPDDNSLLDDEVSYSDPSTDPLGGLGFDLDLPSESEPTEINYEAGADLDVPSAGDSLNLTSLDDGYGASDFSVSSVQVTEAKVSKTMAVSDDGKPSSDEPLTDSSLSISLDTELTDRSVGSTEPSPSPKDNSSASNPLDDILADLGF